MNHVTKHGHIFTGAFVNLFCARKWDIQSMLSNGAMRLNTRLFLPKVWHIFQCAYMWFFFFVVMLLFIHFTPDWLIFPSLSAVGPGSSFTATTEVSMTRRRAVKIVFYCFQFSFWSLEEEFQKFFYRCVSWKASQQDVWDLNISSVDTSGPCSLLAEPLPDILGCLSTCLEL